ncbi:hypothetical protein SAMN04490243_2718 [Robiginitalea myxolifaciens]|uniref:Uncharacterized protein n=1 Tax=Robiginitalea myxolifaciens TaxID=400055 RepID=A0A1I6HGF5_9FLAO|nr:hypothetical protein [Robiginitalea myxolifaciens]SFR53539.1 hypothetical protein SAMN04490243_2718 [Robiginitalea myxolifaciens]
MKRFAMLFVLGISLMGTTSCTNDEGDPEFEILNPEEENTETGIAEKPETVEADKQD